MRRAFVEVPRGFRVDIAGWARSTPLRPPTIGVCNSTDWTAKGVSPTEPSGRKPGNPHGIYRGFAGIEWAAWKPLYFMHTLGEANDARVRDTSAKRG